MKPGIFNGPASGGGQPTITTTADALTTDVTFGGSANAFVDALSHAGLTAGDYFVNAQMLLALTANTLTVTYRLWDGTTTYLEGSFTTTTNGDTLRSVMLAGRITLTGTTTLKLSVAASAIVISGAIKADPTANSSGAHKSTVLSTMKLS